MVGTALLELTVVILVIPHDVKKIITCMCYNVPLYRELLHIALVSLVPVINGRMKQKYKKKYKYLYIYTANPKKKKKNKTWR